MLSIRFYKVSFFQVRFGMSRDSSCQRSGVHCFVSTSGILITVSRVVTEHF